MVYIENITDPINPGIYYTIKIGENQQENNQLVKQAAINDIWFHLSAFPSPHGILITNADYCKIPKKILYRVAELVKGYSKYGFLKNVKVDYIPIKYIALTDVLGCVDIKKKPKIIIVE